MDTLYNFPPDKSTSPMEVYTFETAFTPEELEIIERDVQTISLQDGTILSGTDTKTTQSYRKSSVRWIPQNEKFNWIYERLGKLAEIANDSLWKFDIVSMPEQIQFTEYYENGGHYDWHTDIGNDFASLRKISITVQLSENEDYEGGDFEMLRGKDINKSIRKKGSAILFPSYILHRVTPVTKGTRKSFVLWLGGKPFK